MKLVELMADHSAHQWVDRKAAQLVAQTVDLMGSQWAARMVERWD